MAPKGSPCSACSGQGYILKWTTDKNGKRISYEVSCKACKGTGQN